jgi:tetratricopeptide (TPR) repeat protein
MKKNIVVPAFPFMLLSVAFILLHLFIAFSPLVERGWGMNYISFFEPAVVAGFYLAMAAVCLPWVNGRIVGFVASVSRKRICSAAGKYKLALFFAVAVGAGFVFHALQVKYLFLGDVGVRPTEIEEGKITANEYLSTFILTKLYAWMHSRWEVTGLQTIRIVSYICGGLFVLVSLFTADALGRSVARKTACFVLSVLSLAALMQFCGYSETYAQPLLLLQLYLCVSVLHLQKRLHIAAPIIVLATGVAAHYMLAYMLPSLGFMIYRGMYLKYSFFRKKNTLIALSLLLLVGAYYVFTRIARPMMLPLEADAKIMTLFSAAHYKEFLNAQLLGGGFMFPVWIATLLYAACNKKLKFTALHWFLCIASCSVVAFLFVVDLWRGSGDWDICSFGAIVTNLTAVVFLLDLHEQRLLRNVSSGLCIMGVFALVHTAAWIALNASDRSIGWVEKAFEKDPASYYQNSFSSAAMLGAAFGSNNLPEKSLYWHRKAYMQQPNDPRYGYNYAGILEQDGKTQEAASIYETLLKLHPFYALPYMRLAYIYSESNNYEALYHVLLKMEAAYEENPQAFTSRFPQANIDQCFTILEQLKQSFP